LSILIFTHELVSMFVSPSIHGFLKPDSIPPSSRSRTVAVLLPSRSTGLFPPLGAFFAGLASDGDALKVGTNLRSDRNGKAGFSGRAGFVRSFATVAG
jgi:hypothetical protein